MLPVTSSHRRVKRSATARLKPSRLAAAVPDVDHSRPDAGCLPVDDPRYLTASPQHVAGVVVPLHHDRGLVGSRAAGDLHGPFPHLGVAGPFRRVVARLPVGGVGTDDPRRRWWRAVDAGKSLGQAAQPEPHVGGPPVDPAGQEGHEQRWHPDLAAGGVDGQEVRGGHVDVLDKAKRLRLAPGQFGFFRVELPGRDVKAQHRPVAGSRLGCSTVSWCTADDIPPRKAWVETTRPPRWVPAQSMARRGGRVRRSRLVGPSSQNPWGGEASRGCASPSGQPLGAATVALALEGATGSAGRTESTSPSSQCWLSASSSA